MRTFIASLLMLVAVFLLAGCASMFEVESPRPAEYQTKSAQDIVVKNVPVIVGAQKDKQGKIKEVAVEALKAIKAATPAQADAISNIAANAFGAIEHADGTQKTIGTMMGKTMGELLTMPTGQYLMYAGMQGQVAMQNREKLYEGVKTGFQWTKKAITLAATGATGGGGLIAFALTMLSKARGRKKLLKATGKVIDDFTANRTVEGAGLKGMLAKSAANLPIDAKKEFDIS